MCWTPLYVNKLDVNCIRHDPSYKQQTTGGKDNPSIVFMLKSERTSQHGTRNDIVGQHKLAINNNL